MAFSEVSFERVATSITRIPDEQLAKGIPDRPASISPEVALTPTEATHPASKYVTFVVHTIEPEYPGVFGIRDGPNVALGATSGPTEKREPPGQVPDQSTAGRMIPAEHERKTGQGLWPVRRFAGAESGVV